VDARGADVVALHQVAGLLVDLPGLADEPAGEGLVGVGVEHQVVGDGERLDHAVLVAVLGHVAHAPLVDLAGVQTGDVLTVELDGAGLLGPHAGDGLDQLALAVALHARHAEDLARPHVEGQALHRGVTPVVGHHQVTDPQLGLGGRGRRLLDVEQDLAAHHQRRQRRRGGLAGIGRADHLAPADHRDPVGDRQHLAQLVGDEDDRLALVGEALDHLEELVDLAGRQDGRGLVEDQDRRVAEQGLEQLDPLLLAHRQVGDAGVGVDGEAEAGAQLADASPSGVQVEQRAPPQLLAEDHVLGHRERLHQLEVLVDHADAAGDGVGRAAEAHGLPLDQQLAGVGLVEPEDHVHQRRLAGAVLAQHAVDLAAAQRQVDGVVGEDAGEALGDAPRLEDDVGPAVGQVAVANGVVGDGFVGAVVGRGRVGVRGSHVMVALTT
jgi:hypothetical protein